MLSELNEILCWSPRHVGDQFKTVSCGLAPLRGDRCASIRYSMIWSLLPILQGPRVTQGAPLGANAAIMPPYCYRGKVMAPLDSIWGHGQPQGVSRADTWTLHHFNQISQTLGPWRNP